MAKNPRGDYVAHNAPGVWDALSLPAEEVPAQVDLRADPSFGQAAVQERGVGMRDGLHPCEHPVAPQPDLPNTGYSLNAAPAKPNRLTPAPDSPSAVSPVDPTDIAQWDVWATTQPAGDVGAGL